MTNKEKINQMNSKDLYKVLDEMLWKHIFIIPGENGGLKFCFSPSLLKWLDSEVKENETSKSD